jgi:hypothetical protein
MAQDPNSSPVGGDTGAAAAPTDFGGLQSQVSGIEAEYDPQVDASVATAQSNEGKAVSAEQAVADEEERQAGDDSGSKEIQQWLNNTPTRQAAYATNMHAAPVLAILTALGGKMTRLNGQQMLAATNGIVTGLNESSEQKYDAGWKAWQASFNAMKEHQRELMRMHQLMLQSYQGRADAYQKAAEASRRMTGDLLSAEQKKIGNTINLFKAQQTAVDKLEKINETHRMNDARIRNMLAQQQRMKAVAEKAAKLPPEVQAQIKAETQNWKNSEQQVGELLKQRGQLNSNITMSEEARTAAMQHIDDRVQYLQLQMDSSVQRQEQLSAGAQAAPPKPAAPPPAAAPGAAPAKPGAAPAPSTAGAGAKYADPDAVAAAVANGTLTREAAKQILVSQFGYH